MMKCLGSKTEVESLDDVLNEMTHVLCIFKSIAGRLTDEEHWTQCDGAGIAGGIVDQGLTLDLANDRLERLIAKGRQPANQEV